MSWLEILGLIFLVVFVVMGVVFTYAGLIGLIRFPDVYNRLHATTKTSTLGTLGITIGVMLYSFFSFFDTGDLWGSLFANGIFLKGFVVILFVLLTNPVGGHMIARAAYRTGVPLSPKTLHDHYGEHLDALSVPTDYADIQMELVGSLVDDDGYSGDVETGSGENE